MSNHDGAADARAADAEGAAVSDEDRRPLAEGYKRVPVTLVIHTYDDVPVDWDESNVYFWVEENHCLGNYLTQIQRDEAASAERLGVKEPSAVCNLCSFAEAYVGHLPFPGRK